MNLIKYNLPQVLISYKFRHRGAETCRKSVLIINCNVLSALAGWCTNYKNMHDINNIKFPQSKSGTLEDCQEKGEEHVIMKNKIRISNWTFLSFYPLILVS